MRIGGPFYLIWEAAWPDLYHDIWVAYPHYVMTNYLESWPRCVCCGDVYVKMTAVTIAFTYLIIVFMFPLTPRVVLWLNVWFSACVSGLGWAANSAVAQILERRKHLKAEDSEDSDEDDGDEWD